MNRESNFHINNLKFLLQFAKPFYKECLISIFFIFSATCSVLYIGIILNVLSNYIECSNVTDFSLLVENISLAAVLIVIASLCVFGRIYYFGRLGEKLVKSIRDQLFKKILAQDIYFFESSKAGDLVTRIITDSQVIRIVFIGTASSALRNIILLSGSLALMYKTSIFLTSISLIILPFYIIPNILLNKKIRSLSISAQEMTGEIASLAEENINAIKLIKSSAYEDEITNYFFKATSAECQIISHRIIFYAISIAGIPLFIFLALFFTTYFFVPLSHLNNLNWPDVVTFAYYLSTAVFSIVGLNGLISNFFSYSGSTQRLKTIINIKEDHFYKNKKRHVSSFKGSVQLEEVCFAYPSNPEKLILDKVSMDIKEGQRVAIVGSSGSGKTTIFNLLLGLYPPQSGVIKVSGIDIKEIDIKELRKKVGIVQQEPFIFSGSIYDNLVLDNGGLSDQEIYRALEMVQLLDFIQHLPQKINTFIGRKGIRLSGGQKQRISIARVLLKKPRLLLLDEATSALDSENEFCVQKALEEFLTNTTSITIAHRLSTIIHSDIIYVLKNGQVVQSGPHSVLKDAGLYQNYWHRQVNFEKA